MSIASRPRRRIGAHEPGAEPRRLHMITASDPARAGQDVEPECKPKTPLTTQPVEAGVRSERYAPLPQSRVRGQDPHGADLLPPDRLLRFLEKVIEFPGDGCWIWIGTRDHLGYGRLRDRYAYKRAHRLSYAHFVGPIAPGECVLHRCDDRACVNPAHLWTGTQQENVADMVKKNRQCAGDDRKRVQPRGCDHPFSKLSAAAVEDIRSSYGRGESQRSIAARHGVTQGHVSHVVNRRVWSHVGAP